MKMSFVMIAAIFLMNVFLVGCGNSFKKPLEEVQSDKLVARVASIHLKEGYALIQRYGRLRLGDDAILYTLSVDGETSNLRLTGEQLGQFIAVDIMSGIPVIGDGVYVRNLEEEVDPDSKEVLNKAEN